MSDAPALGQPLPFRLLLDEAVKLGRRHFRQVFLPVALPLGLVAGLMPFFQVRWMRGMAKAGSSPELGGMFGDLALFVVFVLVFSLTSLLGHMALLVAAVDAVAGRPISMARAWSALLSLRAFGTVLLNGMAILLGFCLCVLPGIYLVLLQSLLVPVIVEERRFGPAALARSADLSRYNPRRTFGSDPRVHVFLILFVGFLLNYAVGMVIQLPAIVVQQVLMFRGITGGRHVDPIELMAGLAWIQVPTTALAAMGQAAVQLYVSFAIALLFFDVRRRKEGEDLEAAIDALAAPRGEAGA